MNKYFFIAIVFLVFSCQFVQNKTNPKDPYDPFGLYTPSFNKARVKNDIFQEWTIHNFTLGVHQYAMFDNKQKDSVYAVRSGLKDFVVAINFAAYYNLPLPEAAKTMQINLEYGFRSYENSELIMQVQFNSKTDELNTILIPFPPTFTESDSIVPFSNKVTLLDIPSGSNNCQIQINTKVGVVILANCTIDIDGKILEDFTFNNALPFSEPELQEIKKCVSDTLLVRNQTNLLGIGESVHGSQELVKQATVIIKERIVNQGYNTIFIEASPILGNQINLYVHGHKNDLSELFSMEKNAFNNPYFIDLIEFVKNYNRSNKRTVTFVGFESYIDTSLDSLFSEVASFYPKSPELLTGANILRQSQQRNITGKLQSVRKEEMDKILGLLQNAIEKSILHHSFYENYILNYLQNLIYYVGMPLGINARKHSRDSIMANNVIYYLKQQPDAIKALLYGHFGHIAIKDYKREFRGNYTPSLGYYLKQEYGEKYMSVGLCVGSGTHWAKKYSGYDLQAKEGIYKVTNPIGGSIEQLCEAMDTYSFYINDIQRIPLLDRIVYGRYLGAFWQPMQYEPIDLRKEVDAIWFTLESNQF